MDDYFEKSCDEFGIVEEVATLPDNRKLVIQRQTFKTECFAGAVETSVYLPFRAVFALRILDGPAASHLSLAGKLFPFQDDGRTFFFDKTEEWAELSQRTNGLFEEKIQRLDVYPLVFMGRFEKVIVSHEKTSENTALIIEVLNYNSTSASLGYTKDGCTPFAIQRRKDGAWETIMEAYEWEVVKWFCSASPFAWDRVIDSTETRVIMQNLLHCQESAPTF
jgi:hypothetical protein